VAGAVTTLRRKTSWVTIARWKTTKASREAAQGEEMTMAWTTPTLVEICIGLEINGYLPAEF